MNDHELPKFILNDGYEATPLNTSLFKFVGELASRDHIFMEVDEQKKNDRRRGSFWFRGPGDNKNFDEVQQYMMETGFPLHVNLSYVPKGDEEAYQQYIDQQIEGLEMPDDVPDWLV